MNRVKLRPGLLPKKCNVSTPSKCAVLSRKGLRAIWTMAPSVFWINVLSSLDLVALITLWAVGFLLSRLDGKFSKFTARGVSMAGSSKLILPLLHGMVSVLSVCQQAASSLWDLLHLDLKTTFLQRKHCNLLRWAVIIQLPGNLGYCVRPRPWRNRLDKFSRACGLVPTRAGRSSHVCYEGARHCG